VVNNLEGGQPPSSIKKETTKMMSNKEAWNAMMNGAALECADVHISISGNDYGALTMALISANNSIIPVKTYGVAISEYDQWYRLDFNAEGAGHCSVLTNRFEADCMGNLDGRAARWVGMTRANSDGKLKCTLRGDNHTLFIPLHVMAVAIRAVGYKFEVTTDDHALMTVDDVTGWSA